jgi:hypothetical protein
MSKRRRPGEIVARRPGSCFCGSVEPALVRLSDESDGELHDCDHPCMMHCGDDDCVEWANVQVVGGEHDGGWMYHLPECQMSDPPVEGGK